MTVKPAPPSNAFIFFAAALLIQARPKSAFSPIQSPSIHRRVPLHRQTCFTFSSYAASNEQRSLSKALEAHNPSILQSLDDDNMRQLLFHPPEGGPSAVLVDAYAPWCGPCKLIEPFLEKCAERHSDKLSVIKYNVEGGNNKQLKIEMLLQGVMVRGLPTLLLYDDGKPLATHSGAITEEELESWLKEHLFSFSSNQSSLNRGQENMPSKLGGDSKVEGESARIDDEKKKRGFLSFDSQFGRDDYAL